jgi:outer membrane biosynthesis protein TonB
MDPTPDDAESPREASTKAATEASTKAATEAATRAATRAATQAATRAATNAPTRTPIVRRGDRDRVDDDARERSGVSADDTDVGWGERSEATTRGDDWYRRERPPHHEG